MRDAMNRRKFCLSSVAAAMAGAAVGSASQWPAAATRGIPLYIYVYDRRYAASRDFGAAAEHARSTAGIAAVGGDITTLWSRDLRPRWSAGGGAIAGMTTARTLFCLEQLAKDHWMRVVLRAEHALSEGHGMVHRLTASRPMIARLRSALVAEDWPARMPAALASCAGTDDAPSTSVIGSTCDRPLAHWDETLVSFVIA